MTARISYYRPIFTVFIEISDKRGVRDFHAPLARLCDRVVRSDLQNVDMNNAPASRAHARHRIYAQRIHKRIRFTH